MKTFAGVWWGLMSGAALAVTYGLFPANAGWIPAWLGLAPASLRRGVGADEQQTLGVAPSRWVSVSSASDRSPKRSSCSARSRRFWSGWAPYAIGLALAAFVRDDFDGRQRLALILASAALVPAGAFALAPEQTGLVMLAVFVGAACMWGGAWGVARGRTWGLLLGLLGAPILGVSVAYAPSTAYFDATHFMVSQPLQPLMLDVLGLVATACAASLGRGPTWSGSSVFFDARRPKPAHATARPVRSSAALRRRVRPMSRTGCAEWTAPERRGCPAPRE